MYTKEKTQAINPPTKKFSLTGISNRLTAFSKIPVSLLKIIGSSLLVIFVIFFIFVFTYYTYLEFRQDLVIEIMDLPKELQEKGYTNQILKKMIIAKLDTIGKPVMSSFPDYDTSLRTSSERENKNLPERFISSKYGSIPYENPPKLEVGLEGISIPLDSFINFFVKYMKRFFGYSQTHVICNITLQSDSESLKITTQINRNVEEKNSSLENLDSIISDIVEYIYKCKEPFTLAYYYYVNGHPNECFESLKHCLQNNIFSDDHLAYNLLGRILYIQKNYDDAIKKYKMATRLHPKFAPAYYNCGLALHDKGLHDKAIVKYMKALEIDDRCAPAYYYLGVALYNIGKYDEAIKNFQEFIELAPDDQLVDEAKRYINKLTEETEQDNGSVPK